MRTCARCGHKNPEDASSCEQCHGLMTLQLHAAQKSELSLHPEQSPHTIPDVEVPSELGATLSFEAPSEHLEEASEQKASAVSLELGPMQMESLSAGSLLPEDSVMAASASLGPASSQPLPVDASLGFSLAGSSVHDSAIQLYEQLQSGVLRDPLLGQEVGNFRFIEKIGKGGFGAVYRAEQVFLGEPVAIKVLHLHQIDNPEVVRRFQREARALAQLKHPNIVQMIDFGMLPNYGFYLVMEFLTGDNLFERLKAREPFPPSRLKQIFGQLCDVLHFVHQKGIVHRDLKMSNIYLTPEGEHEKVTLLDFGIAAVTDDIDPITQTGAYIGTATYASPEQAQGLKDLDGRSDLYSMAVLLFRLLAGKPPFQGNNSMDITHRKLASAAPTLAEVAPRKIWAPELETLMASALQRNREKRPPNAMAFWSWAEQALDAQTALNEVPREEAMRIVMEAGRGGRHTEVDVAAAAHPERLGPSVDLDAEVGSHTLDVIPAPVEELSSQTLAAMAAMGSTQEWSASVSEADSQSHSASAPPAAWSVPLDAPEDPAVDGHAPKESISGMEFEAAENPSMETFDEESESFSTLKQEGFREAEVPSSTFHRQTDSSEAFPDTTAVSEPSVIVEEDMSELSQEAEAMLQGQPKERENDRDTVADVDQEALARYILQKEGLLPAGAKTVETPEPELLAELHQRLQSEEQVGILQPLGAVDESLPESFSDSSQTRRSPHRQGRGAGSWLALVAVLALVLGLAWYLLGGRMG